MSLRHGLAFVVGAAIASVSTPGHAQEPTAPTATPSIRLVIGVGLGGSFLAGTMLFEGYTNSRPGYSCCTRFDFDGLGAGYTASAKLGVAWQRWQLLLDGDGAYFPDPAPDTFRNGSSGSFGASVGIRLGPPRVSFYGELGFGYRWTTFNFYIQCPVECAEYARLEAVQWSAAASLDLRLSDNVHVLLPVVRAGFPYTVRIASRVTGAEESSRSTNDDFHHPEFHAFFWVGTEVRFEIPLGGARRP